MEETLNQLAAGHPQPPGRAHARRQGRERECRPAHGRATARVRFRAQAHWDLGPALGILDFERGVKITGSRFYVLSGAGARLQRALIAYMLDLHIRQGYTEQYTPFMVKAATLFAAGQLPKFADNLYHDAEEDLWMVPTAEVPLTGLHMDEILEEDQTAAALTPPTRPASAARR